MLHSVTPEGNTVLLLIFSCGQESKEGEVNGGEEEDEGQEGERCAVLAHVLLFCWQTCHLTQVITHLITVGA